MSSAQVEIGRRMIGLRKARENVNKLKKEIEDQKLLISYAEEHGENSFEYREELAQLEVKLEEKKSKLDLAINKAKDLAENANLGVEHYKKNLDRLRMLEISEENCLPRKAEYESSNRSAEAFKQPTRSAQEATKSIRPKSRNRPASSATPRIPPITLQEPTAPRKIKTALPMPTAKYALPKPIIPDTPIIPNTNLRASPATTRLVQPTGFLKPQSQAINRLRPPSVPSEMIPVRTKQLQQQFVSRMPQLDRKTVQLDKAIQLQQQIERHKRKQFHAQKIAKFGNLQNLKQHVQLKDQPKLIPSEEAVERIKVYKETVKNAKAVGNLKRQAAGPNASEFAPSAVVRAKEAEGLKIKLALNAQRKKAAQTIIKRAQEIAVSDPEPLIEKLNFKVPENMTASERMAAENREVQEMKTLLIKTVCQMYNGFKRNEPAMDSATSKVMLNKLKKDIKYEVEKILDLIRVCMAAYRGSTFRQDEVTRNKFVQTVLMFLSRNPKPNECIDALKKIWRENPLPRFKMEPKRKEEPLNPLETLKKPPSAVNFRSRLQRPASKPARAASEIKKALKNLQVFQEHRGKSSTREQLEKFTGNFCEIFCQNHKTNRIGGFTVWRKPFFDNLDNILDDLEEFYETLPHVEASKFDRLKITKQFNDFLFALFEATKSRDITANECSKIVGDKMQTSAEVGRMKNLQKILNVFRTKVHEVIDPHVSRLEQLKFTPSRTNLRSKNEHRGEVNEKNYQKKSPPKSMSGSRKLSDEARKSMFRIINLWGSIRARFCQYVSSEIGMSLLEKEIRKLYEEFRDSLYGGEETEEMIEDFHKIDTCFMNLMEFGNIPQQDCEVLLNASGSADPRESSNLAPFWCREVIRELTRVYEKYMLKIVNGEAKPEFKKKSPSPRKALDSSDEDYEKSISTKSPTLVISKLKTSVRASPSSSAKVISPSKGLSTTRSPRTPKESQTISPVVFLPGMETPVDVIERDILFVACQLINRSEGDLPVTNDRLVRDVLRVAKQFKHMGLTEAEAIRTIGSVFWELPCVSHDFINNFTYHPFNQFFESLKISDETENLMIRANILRDKNMKKCDTERLQNDRSVPIDEDFSSFHQLNVSDESVEEVIEKMEQSGNGDLITKLNGDVSICGHEVEMLEEDLLPVPTEISEITYKIVTCEETKESLKSIGEFLPEPVIVDSINDEMKELEARVKKQLEELELHKDNSRILGEGIKHELRPTALDRKNFWQSCGRDLPKWFPGFFTVFQDSFNYKPTQVFSPDSVFLHAWRSMAPMIEQN